MMSLCRCYLFMAVVCRQEIAGFLMPKSWSLFWNLNHRASRLHHDNKRNLHSVPDATTSTIVNASNSVKATESTSSSSSWAKYALLISSFTDGVQSSQSAQRFLKYSLASCLLDEQYRSVEATVRESVMASPCNGPDIAALDRLEEYDQKIQKVRADGEQEQQHDPYSDVIVNGMFDLLQQQKEEPSTEIRLLYIPTAMYALNPNSSRTPGKQRQSNRYDGKQKRKQVMQHLHDLVADRQIDAKVLAITLDLDDGSLKQPEGSEESSHFPTDGIESLTTWAPHIVYLEGGNTFWLQYCVDKGHWAEHLRQACVGPNATSIYIGKSAGAILAGTTVETATWKGWDDPSIVPDKESYEDWKGQAGLSMAGSQCFFPHMSEKWELLVEEKRAELDDQFADGLVCLGDFDACCVDGRAQRAFVVSEGAS